MKQVLRWFFLVAVHASSFLHCVDTVEVLLGCEGRILKRNWLTLAHLEHVDE